MTPEEPTWTILVPTLQRRESRFAALRDKLLRQCDPYGGRVRVCALWNRGQRPLGELRQALITHVLSDYVSFVDDDDEVPPYFVEEVVRALESWPDQVGWRMQCVRDGAMLKPTFHSIKYDSWWEDDAGYYRDVSHLNPVRRELALKCDFRRGEPPEDVAWVNQMRGLVRTEHEISNKVMYYYLSSSVDSTWQLGSVSPPTAEELEAEPPYVAHHDFFYHPLSYTEEPCV